MCLTNTACDFLFNATNATTTGYCDRTYVTYDRKAFSCNVTAEEFTSLIGDYISIQCSGVPANDSSSARGICDMQVFDSPSMEETFYCRLDDCYSKWGPGDAVTYACSHTHCNCSMISPKCQNPFVIFVLEGMHGKGVITCDDKTKVCSITRKFTSIQLTQNRG